ncbi:GNAT family N-acetyltransferase [Arthrobacter sp. CJ23]|uniref:GNAT family N-acetyltransferase n=1 Tax=Arthrobacter sp. CJ23 TaxID=2972479 RepID=UPI00215C5C9A|nr:GNAT family N-acetyltransferase [Arthrobacter sp. CJ23]UVJ41472.1 GNAT family N-acetyltransferase [Arthrobacter sp. CJ23]
MSQGEPTPDVRRLDVRLLDVTEEVLERLLDLALGDADPDEVTPPLGAGWNAERIEWFRKYHRDAMAGLDGTSQEKSWAIVTGGRIAGSIRLKRTGPGAVETGIWLGRSFRSQGFGGLALKLVAAEAASAGATVLEAATTPANRAAQALLRSAGAALSEQPGSVRARLGLLQPPVRRQAGLPAGMSQE